MSLALAKPCPQYAEAPARNSVRFLCCGDLHLSKGLDYGRSSTERLAEQEAAWARCLALAREHAVDACLFAGDAFETPRPSPDSMLAFERPLVEHRDAGGCPVVAIVGNHDVAAVQQGTGLEVFHEAGLLELYRADGAHEVAGVQVVCLPWAPTSRIVAAQAGGDRDDVHRFAAELLLNVAHAHRGAIAGPAVLLTHFAVTGGVTPDGIDAGLFREPVLSLDELVALGYEAVVLGHIHKPQLLTQPHDGFEEDAGPVFYVGSPLPLTFGEAKCDHGCWLLDLAETEREGVGGASLSAPGEVGRAPGRPGQVGPGSGGGTSPRSVSARFLPVESRPFVEHQLDLTTGDGVFALSSERPQVEGAVVKLTIRCTRELAGSIDLASTRRELYEAGAHKVWQLKLDVVREQRARVVELDDQVDDLRALELYLEAAGVDGDQAAVLRERTERYLRSVT